MRVIVTRPAAQADPWVRSLAAKGVDAVALPLIDISPPEDPAAVDAAWQTLAAQRLVVFVSPNAAQEFFRRRPPALAWPAGVTAASIGPGTTQTLLRLGVPLASVVEPSADSGQFDSEALWQQLRSHGRLQPLEQGKSQPPRTTLAPGIANECFNRRPRNCRT